MSNKNNSPEQKAAWFAVKSLGSRFMRWHPQPRTGKHSRKGYRAPRGSFMDRVLRKIAGRWQAGQVKEKS